MRLVLAGALIAAPLGAAQAQDVRRFLVRVDRLLARGPFALLSRDFYRLKREIEADGESLKADFAREKAAGRSTLFCPPTTDKPRVGKTEFLAALRAVPVSKRSTTDTKDVLRTLLEHKYPCR
ncbi:MAG: hypothetical protein ABIR87_02310 [Sphingomicrobium sp.]